MRALEEGRTATEEEEDYTDDGKTQAYRDATACCQGFYGQLLLLLVGQHDLLLSIRQPLNQFFSAFPFVKLAANAKVSPAFLYCVSPLLGVFCFCFDERELLLGFLQFFAYFL